MKIGVFVGSFDPVHKGHTNIMNYLVDKKIVDKVLVIATGNYWDKQNITDLKIRLDMLDLIKNKNIIIDKKHNKLKYTYEILRALKKENPQDEFYLVIGADNANTLYKWKHFDEIIKYGIIVLGRNNIKITLEAKKLIVIDKSFGNISSTKIRNDVDKWKEYLSNEVYHYIKTNNLYSLK